MEGAATGGAMVAGGFVVKGAVGLLGRAAAKTGSPLFTSVDDLIGAAGKLNKSRIGSVKGNADEIFNSLTKGATKTSGGAIN